MRIAIFLLSLVGSNAIAKCDDLLSVLSKYYPNRVFVEKFGYNETYAVYEPALTEEVSKISIFRCIGKKHINKAKFSFKIKKISGLDYSEKYRKLFVYFVYETEQYGWINENGDSYEFELFNDPEL